MSNFYPVEGAVPASPLGMDESAALGIIQHLEALTLQNLLEDDEKLNDLINDLHQVKGLQLKKETLLARNKSVADYNLSQEPKLAEGRKLLASIYESAVKLSKEFEQEKTKLDYIISDQSLDTTLALLQTETAKIEEESEKLSESFLDAKVPVDEYLESFIEKRTQAHLYKIRCEKMAELLRNQEKQNRQAIPSQPSGWGTVPNFTDTHYGSAGSQQSQQPYPSFSGMPDPSAYKGR